MNKEKLDKILELHRKWLNDEVGGEKANLTSANLRGANLSYANLRGADLSSADLRAANLRAADLRFANLRGANLRAADLRFADLSSANLRVADLRSAGLIGITAPIWTIYVNRETTSIGCEIHENDEWRKFKDSRIKLMDSQALDWWHTHKAMVFAAMDVVENQEVEDEV